MNKQIEEMARVIFDEFDGLIAEADATSIAVHLARKGYRKSTDVAREIFDEIDESFSQMLEEAENTIADAIQEENRSVARIAQYGRDVLILARNTLEKILKKKYESEGADDE